MAQKMSDDELKEYVQANNLYVPKSPSGKIKLSGEIANATGKGVEISCGVTVYPDKHKSLVETLQMLSLILFMVIACIHAFMSILVLWGQAIN